MNGRDPLLYAAGLTCPAGETFPDAVSAYASGDYFFAKERALIGADGLPMVLASVYPWGEPDTFAKRLHKLISSAHADCLTRITSLQTLKRFPMLLVLPQWMQGKPVMEQFAQCLRDAPLERVATIKVTFGGRADGLCALYQGCLEVAKQGAGGVFVAAVDSYLHQELLDRLAFRGMVLGKDTPYGFVPGEGATVLFVSHPQFAGPLQPIGRLTGIGWTSPQQDAESSAVAGAISGRELAASYREALGFLRDDVSLDRLVVDLNGDRRRAEEFGYAVSAAGSAPLSALAADPEAPASYLGDLGAATGLVMAALALGPKPVRRRRSSEPTEEPEPLSQALQTSFLSISSMGSGLHAAALIEAPAFQIPEISS